MIPNQYTIATLGSHSALQILKGGKDEGFNTLLVTTHERSDFYRRFRFIDQIIEIPSLSQFPRIEKKLKVDNCILIPHGSFIEYLGINGNKKITIPYFGNKKVLDWETDRQKQRSWLKKSRIRLPRQFKDLNDVYFPVIVKSYGAAGGKGYFYAKNKTDLQKKLKTFPPKKYIIQEYIIGVTMYFHYFYSNVSRILDLMSVDRRYETNVDSLGRIPLMGQTDLSIEPSYVVVGNSPLSVRESLLPQVYRMGEQVVSVSRKIIDKYGLYGPFCLETVITPDQKIYVIEISCRIVAGTNLFMNGSPYSWLIYDEPMSMGRRIAKEIKMAIKQNKLDLITD